MGMRQVGMFLPMLLVISQLFCTLPAQSASARTRPLNVVVFGAHPDDPEKSGGTMAMFVNQGHRVYLVTLTNGNAGHQEMGGGPLAKRRLAEAKCAGEVIGATYLVLDNDDGKLLPTLENREKVIRLIREFNADIVITHRPNDYHPDHRNTGLLVQDAAYMVTVPNIVPATPHLMTNPVILYMSDHFEKPAPFEPDLVVGVDAVIEKKMDMYHCHDSQMYEWLPYNAGRLDEVPSDPAQRREWLGRMRKPGSQHLADQYRKKLVELYGETRGGQIRYAEAFEVSEYGSQPGAEELKALFPFFH